MEKYAPLLEADDEVVTHSYVSDVKMPSGRTIALITLDNGKDHTRPNTLGPHTLLQFAEKLDELKERAKKKGQLSRLISGFLRTLILCFRFRLVFSLATWTLPATKPSYQDTK